jgi:hypothetical protein
MSEKENRQRAEQQRMLARLKVDEDQQLASLLEPMAKIGSGGPRREGSLILNGNKILNEAKTINDVLNDLKELQRVPTMDLVLTDEVISKPIKAVGRPSDTRLSIGRPSDKPIFHNESNGFQKDPLPGRSAGDTSFICSPRLSELSMAREPYTPTDSEASTPFTGQRIVDCSDVYALIEAQMRRNKMVFNARTGY